MDEEQSIAEFQKRFNVSQAELREKVKPLFLMMRDQAWV